LPPQAAEGELAAAAAAGGDALRKRGLVAVTADADPSFARLLELLRQATPVPIVPVYCYTQTGVSHGPRRVRVIIGEALPPETPAEEVVRCVERLADELANPSLSGSPSSIMLLPSKAGDQ
jgi:hypothetical protein